MKKKILIVLVIIIIILVFSLILIKTTNNKTEETEHLYTYLLYSQTSDGTVNNDLNDMKMIFTFNENNICIDCRIMYDFVNEEDAKLQYENWCEIENNKNVKINSSKVSFNTYNYNNKTKDEILEIDFGDGIYTDI